MWKEAGGSLSGLVVKCQHCTCVCVCMRYDFLCVCTCFLVVPRNSRTCACAFSLVLVARCVNAVSCSLIVSWDLLGSCSCSAI